MKFLNSLGSLMAILGALAIVLGYLDRVPTLLMWIYNWGESTAWVIKIALIVVGGGMWLFSRRAGTEQPELEETSSES